MARGDSGRIVIEVDPNLKAHLYVALTRQQLTLKAWFVAAAEEFLHVSEQPSLFAAESQAPPYSAVAIAPDLSEKP